MHYQRVVFNDLVHRRTHASPREFVPLVHAALDENREDGRADDPRRVTAHPVEHRAVRERLGLELGALRFELVDGKAEAAHHLEKESGVRYAERELSSLLFEEIFGESDANVGRRALTENASQEDGKVAHVRLILVAEVRQELGSAEAWPREPRPGEVVLSIHDREQSHDERVREIDVHHRIVTLPMDRGHDPQEGGTLVDRSTRLL